MITMQIAVHGVVQGFCGQNHYLRELDSFCRSMGTESDRFWHKEKEVGLA
jgi:hypothetical protein